MWTDEKIDSEIGKLHKFYIWGDDQPVYTKSQVAELLKKQRADTERSLDSLKQSIYNALEHATEELVDIAEWGIAAFTKGEGS